ncbi:MAG: ATP-grasp domain-containing protein [Lachnospiraceae bacterium]|nr:ATP-grasp domain-containing protein [Lachnospiraceae bacterium]
MKIYIKTDNKGIPETDSDYTAWQGFQALGLETFFYNSEKEIENTRPDDLIVGGVSIIKRKLGSYGIEIPEYDYPEELEKYFGRSIWTDSLEGILNKQSEWPVFVKPVRDKAFVGFVLKSEKDVPRLREFKSNESVLCSELVDFEAEFRAFTRYGKIWDVRPYRGDWHVKYDSNVLDEMVKEYTRIPAGCAVDIGVTKDGRTLLVEINDGFALGCYGAESIQYAKLLSARWCELVGIHDECDIFFEGADWKKMHRQETMKSIS